ncbi:MAG: nucleotidyltransferase domain-containing protein, partial [Deltaproteobacteria bacterium]|nr:nucleotidyltransferase domain-containing protein [Deltaproteobacteria bacterium]
SPRYPVVVTPEILQTISQKIVENFQPQKVILFGSHAWGKPKPESDIDLLVVTNALSPLRPAQRRLQVKHVCQPPLVPMDVLVHTPEEIGEKSEAGDLFLAKILAEGKVLYDKSPD